MFGANIALNHQFSQARSRDFLAEAERQRSANIALDAQRRSRRPRLSAIRSSVASVLLRAGSWLMPEEPSNGCGAPANGAFELRPGQ